MLWLIGIGLWDANDISLKGLEIVIFLVLLERLGKAFRTPSRDTVISIVSKGRCKSKPLKALEKEGKES